MSVPAGTSLDDLRSTPGLNMLQPIQTPPLTDATDLRMDALPRHTRCACIHIRYHHCVLRCNGHRRIEVSGP